MMKPSHAIIAIKTAIQVQRPVFLWGPPGSAKSQIVRQVADSLGIQIIDFRATLHEPLDLKGLPSIQDGITCWSIPEFLPTDGQGIFFADELTSAVPAMQAAFYQLFLERRIGKYKLPQGWAMIGAGNRETDRAISYKMPSALANRLIHLDIEVDLDDWSKWALSSGITPEIIAFVHFRPELLHNFDPKKGEKAFPTPRSWQFVSQILDAQPDNSIAFDLVAGTIGEGAAAEFMAFLGMYRDLPSPDAILLSPTTAKIPSEPSGLYAVAMAIATRVTEVTAESAVAYLDRLPDDFSVLAMTSAIQRNSALQHTAAFIQWAVNHQDVFK